MDYKKHYKLYKAGKNWCCAAILSASIILGTSVLTSNAFADSTTGAADQPATVQVVAGQQTQSSNTTSSDTAAGQPADQSAATTVKTAASNNSQQGTQKTAQTTATVPAQTTTTDQTQAKDNSLAQVQAPATSKPNSFSTINGNVYYYGNDGTLAKNQWYTNWGNKYYFGADGARYTSTTANIPAKSADEYYFDNQGVMATNYFQTRNGKVYYFGNDGKEYKDQFYTNWGHTYYFGKDGARYTNQFYNNWGHTYYFGSDGARWDNSFMVRWGHAYYFGNDGALLTSQSRNIQGTTYNFDKDGVITNNQNRFFTDHDGKVYYFDNNGQEYVNRFYNNWGHTYYFGNDGARYTNQFYSNWGHMYYFGADGARYTNQFYSNWGHMYYFGADGARYTNQFYNNWGHTYYFGNDGARWDNSFMVRWGHAYYFGNDGALLTNQTRNINGTAYSFDRDGVITNNKNRFFIDHDGKVYYFDNNGEEYINKFYNNWGHTYYFGADGARYTNQWYTVPGTSNTYYFGSDGAAVTGRQTINNKVYYFDQDGKQATKLTAKVENGKLVVYNAADNKVVETLDSGTWENMAYSLDANSINNTDGYLSYAGWYRPYGTSQDGKTWYKTSVSDWRPILMYTWPSKDVEAQFIKYFVNNGYENANYGLTKASVASLSKDTDSKTLDNDAQNLRYVIEQSIAAHKSTSQLANDVSAFMKTVPALSSLSELPVEYSKGYYPGNSGTTNDDQVLFVNNDSKDQKNGNTSYADSKYRLLNRTLFNQDNKSKYKYGELLVGNDIDNSNPTVQAENLNWEYYLLNYGKIKSQESKDYNADGNFDGFRIDAVSSVDADTLDQLSQLVNDMYHTKGNQVNANNHLLYNETWDDKDVDPMNKKGNQQLYMDGNYYYTIQNVLGKDTGRDSISDLITKSVVNRSSDTADNWATPNWSFVMNHDQFKNIINQMIIDSHPGVSDIMASGYKKSYETQELKAYYEDEAKTHKRYAVENVPAKYAILLSNKDTVPQVYYGDLYKENDPYMKTKSMYYDAITTLMKARGEFVAGGQTMKAVNNNLLTSVRYGKGVKDENSIGSDALSRTTGMAVVVGNSTSLAEQTVEINMGKEHANQTYKNLVDTTDNGLTYNGTGSLNAASLKTDANGILRVKVKGYANPYITGYLSVWVPEISGTQDARTQTTNTSSTKTFQSNAALDSHMIYEDFGLYEPMPTTKAEHAYNVIAQNASLFNQLGITDFWMAPAYMPFGMSRYNEGYSMTDRYNLGTDDNPTKYGTGAELTNAIAALHKAGLKVQEDIVMNQMIGFSTPEAVTVNRVNSNGDQQYVDGKTFKNQIYFAYTRGGGQGQKEYGGKYLADLQKQYPDLFTTKAISTGVAPDPTTKITEWSAKYENGTSLQNIGIGLAVKLANGNYAYLNGGDNKTFPTTLPAVMSSADYYASQLLNN